MSNETETQTVAMRPPNSECCRVDTGRRLYDGTEADRVDVDAADVDLLTRLGWESWCEPIRMTHPRACAWHPAEYFVNPRDAGWGQTVADKHYCCFGAAIDVHPEHVDELLAEGWQRVEPAEEAA